jgi:peptidoglycan/LPS O-acetylase OafA/YrhL
LSKGLAKLFITAAEGWSRMYRMRRLLSRSEWLLVDEPEEPDLFLAALFLFMSCFALTLPLLDLYEGESVVDDLVPLALVPMFLAWAALYAWPTHWRRTMLWVRVAHALGLVGGLALIVYSDAVDARSVWEPVVFAAVTVLLLFVVLLFRYRRRRGRRYY